METSLSRSAVGVGRVELRARMLIPHAGRTRPDLHVIGLLLAIGWAVTLGLALVGLAAVTAPGARLHAPTDAQATIEASSCGGGRWPICLSRD
jgi:hypothetical protein